MKVGRNRVGGRRRQRISIEYGGDERIRTADLLSAIQALSQLSYVPTAAADPSSALSGTAWVAGEFTEPNGEWGTAIANIAFTCSPCF